MNARRNRGPLGSNCSNPLFDWQQTLRRTNVTGLASRRDYESAFAPLVRETRKAMCAPVPFLVALRGRGVSVGSLGAVGAFAPNEQLPHELRDLLVDMNEVMEATGTQVLEMREHGEARAREFSVQGRIEVAVRMVALGDTDGAQLRQTAWTRNGQGDWHLSALTKRAAARDGLSQAGYKQMAKDLRGVLPPAGSRTVARARTADQKAGRASTAWISYAGLATVVETT